MEMTPWTKAILLLGLVCLGFSGAAIVDFLYQANKKGQAFLVSLVCGFLFLLGLTCVIAAWQGESFLAVSGILCFFNGIVFGMALGVWRNLSAITKPGNVKVVVISMLVSFVGALITGTGIVVIH